MINRKARYTTVFACALAVLLAGCGTANNTSTNQTTSTGTSQAKNTAQFPITLTDDAGDKVTVQKQPQHIASGTEGTDEILASLVPKSRIALVTNLSSDPTYSNVANLVKGIPQMSKADSEKILSTNPDLVLLASYVTPGVVKQVRDAGVPVYEFDDFTSVQSIEKNIKVIGKLVGATAKANAIVTNMNDNMQKLKNAVKGQKPVTVLDYSSYGFAAGKNTTTNDEITMAGGVNVAANLDGWKQITDEEIVKMNPDVIIDATDDKGFLQKLQNKADLQSVSAIRNHRLYAIPDADLSSVSQYVVQGGVDLAKVFYPKANIPDIQVMQ
jgi:iron complex transport system substrate-binding protein